MNCLKCGAEMKESGAFCDTCLEDMAKYPVKPNVTVQLPRRPDIPATKKKKAKKVRIVKPEDQIRQLKLVRNWLIGLLAASLLAFAASSAMVVHLLTQDENTHNGQNYETNDSTSQS